MTDRRDQGRDGAAHSVSVFRADQLRVVNGANQGDGLGFCAELIPDDIYNLSPVATLHRMALLPAVDAPFRIAPGSQLGTPGAELHLDCVVTFMTGDGRITEGLVLVETDGGDVAGIYLMPLGEMSPRVDYALMGIDPDGGLAKFAQLACVSFTAGTMITLASGAQVPVESLTVGERVLTRDDGAQTLRWIGHGTTRASGDFAPVLIRQGVLNNARDLLVSPDHRLFIYQREDRLGAGRAEVMIKARHLVDGERVMRVSGGFVDYYQMLFDHHQIIYAEGIAAESMLVDNRTRAVLPREVAGALSTLLPGHSVSDHHALEVEEALLDRPGLAELLRRASSS
ncbi:Hint domain-containing protein [Citreicella sp. C3M06]|uniref:Hint domain-containing protein n=1 Tax=Citreicella sp. C3M06 TaxID=2841564 RepID=UPI001C095A11|nr:Hint domain-containing protein [Citreicella sp. C3M06]MBU2963709.1 Hint domain-containing protein [Citreicella sp. C3M06]